MNKPNSESSNETCYLSSSSTSHETGMNLRLEHEKDGSIFRKSDEGEQVAM